MTKRHRFKRTMLKLHRYVLRPLAQFTIAVARWLKDFFEQVNEVSRERYFRP